MVAFMRAILEMEWNMDRVYTSGVMEATIGEIGNQTSYMGLESIFGQMEDHMRDNGIIVKCMGKESTLGKMDDHMKGSIDLI